MKPEHEELCELAKAQAKHSGPALSAFVLAMASAIRELDEDAEFRLIAQSREAEEARFYRYLRDEAGTGDDDAGPMICSGLGDNFDYLRGEECDEEIRAAIDKARAALEGKP